MIKIVKYHSSYFNLWNQFINDSKNGTFLFHRDFMEYHKDRFEDYSLMVFENENLVAVLPCNSHNSKAYSHQGLTYGGLILTKWSKLRDVLNYFREVLKFLAVNGFKSLQIKQIPAFYLDCFSDEIEYCLFITQAQLIRRDALSTLDLRKPFKISKSRRESIRRGIAMDLKIVEEDNFKLFWEKILIPNLFQKHNAKPVHSLTEIEQLHAKFRDNIRHFNVYHKNEIVAGTTIFIANEVVHPQYISGNALKNELGSLDYLYFYLINEVFKDKSFFDFGISNEEQGRKINQGLLFWKESFGAKTVIQNFYEINTNNHVLLENVLI